MENKGNTKKNMLPREIILQDLRSKISNSMPGTRLPSENALAIKFNTARMTVTRVFKQLEDEGLIERKKGCGSFVKGMRTVSFLLPYPEFITEQLPMAEIFRSRLHGAIRASQDLRLKLNIFPVLKEKGAFYSPQIFQDFSPANLVITSSMMPECFQYLFESKVRTVMFYDSPLPHGMKQYTYDWITIEKDFAKAVNTAISRLQELGCKKIAVCGKEKEDSVFSVCNIEKIIFLPCCNSKNDCMQQLLSAHQQHNFDGLILCAPQLLSEKYLSDTNFLPGNVKICGINIPGKRVSGTNIFLTGNTNEDIMGYDAVKYLVEAPRMGIRKKYEYMFESTKI